MVAMVAMVATGQKSTLGAVARHPGAGVGYPGRIVGFVHDWWPPGVAARLPCSRVPVPRALGASRAPQRLHAASSRTGRGSLGLWGGSRVMATMHGGHEPKSHPRCRSETSGRRRGVPGRPDGRHGRGPCGSRPRTRRFHADARCTTREPRLGRRDDAIRVRPSMATMATMATPS